MPDAPGRPHERPPEEDTRLKLPDYAPLHLMHQASIGTLATHAREPHGFPYPTLLPFAPDARHRPVILVSRLAEHTGNLQGDPRAGFLVALTGEIMRMPGLPLRPAGERIDVDDAGEIVGLS